MTVAAWTTKPSWGIVAGADKIINPDLERWYCCAVRTATNDQIGRREPSSVYESHPQQVAAVIEDAAKHAQQ